MDLLYKRLPFDNQEKELKSLKNQLNFLENTTLIPPSSPYIPTTYIQNPPQIVGPMYSESSISLRVLFSPEDWERTFKKPKPQKTQSKVLTKPRDPPPNPEKRPQLMIKNPISEFLERTQQHQNFTTPPVLTINGDNDSSINTSSNESSYESSDEQPLDYMADTAQTSQEQPTEQQLHAAESTPEVVQEEPTVISADDDITSPSAPIFINPSLPTPNISSVKFTLDDVPPQKWKTRFQEMQVWCFTELQRPHMTHSRVIKSFLVRLTGFMKDWFDSLGQYRQLQYLNAPTVDEFLNALYWEFCGKQDHLKDIARKEFFKLKCCSYNPKDLNKHFENAVRRFYLIGGMDDPNIKQAYLEYIPQPLGQETLRVIEMRGQSLGTTSFGELHNMGKRSTTSKDSNLTKGVLNLSPRKGDSSGTSSQRRKKTVASSVGRKDILQKNCPKQKKTKVLQQIYATTQVDDKADLESLFSEQDEQSSDTIFILEEDPEDNLSSNSDDEFSSDECYGIQIIGLSLSVPMVEVKIFPSKYDRPTIVAGLFDTGAACSILNPTVFPPSMWKFHRQIFQAANNEYFSTEVMSKHVTIQFFLNCSISHKLLGSSLPGKDIVIGFDIIQQLWAKKVIPKYNGLQYKSHFLPYIKPTTYFSMSSLHSLTELLIRDCCVESHTDFLTKCTSPLWKNPEFYVSLPFKLNEDANPTKASHTGYES
ncbi:Reverse transcriptase domain-containing protein [Abeliophyllum distichum]|uniref:Reverse transcriptase domain-containing protein n=1 Tax=Abeliophyllum distichum TaxID=126358 RepID=A0ABD1U0I9_9LAMI